MEARYGRKQQKVSTTALVQLGITASFSKDEEQEVVVADGVSEEKLHEEKIYALLNSCPSRSDDYNQLQIEAKIVSLQSLNPSLTEYQTLLKTSYEAYFQRRNESSLVNSVQ